MTLEKSRVVAVTLVFLALSALFIVHAEESTSSWPQFRGPDRSGLSTDTGLIDAWPESGLVEVWRQNVTAGFSSISAHENRFYTMLSEDSLE